ncbi:MAG: hypothetical protein V3T58_03060 [Candidatus Hydrothermarchaeales archaeon]
MRAAVSNSTPLIYLARLGKIDLLKKVFDKIYIPNEVFEEVVAKGKRLNKKEVFLIERLIKEGFIEVREVQKRIENVRSLHAGEMKAISLCSESNAKAMLIDDKEGYEFAKLLNLHPYRTTALLLRFYKEGLIDYDEFCDLTLKLSEEGYFMSARVYKELLKTAKLKI